MDGGRPVFKQEQTAKNEQASEVGTTNEQSLEQSSEQRVFAF